MSLRETPLAVGEYYHIFNRGVDKRAIFTDAADQQRFLQSMAEFNTTEPIGSLYEINYRNKNFGGRTATKTNKNQKRIVELVCFCLNPNHYHFLLRQLVDQGISEFMKRLSGGYTWYFNHKNDRTGSLFGGKFKSKHVDSNEYLLHVSAYINLNDRVHRLDHNGGPTAKTTTAKKVKSVSSWDEYISGVVKMCNSDIVLGQFRDRQEYKKFALDSLEDILERREEAEDVRRLLLE